MARRRCARPAPIRMVHLNSGFSATQNLHDVGRLVAPSGRWTGPRFSRDGRGGPAPNHWWPSGSRPPITRLPAPPTSGRCASALLWHRKIGLDRRFGVLPAAGSAVPVQMDLFAVADPVAMTYSDVRPARGVTTKSAANAARSPPSPMRCACAVSLPSRWQHAGPCSPDRSRASPLRSRRRHQCGGPTPSREAIFVEGCRVLADPAGRSTR